MSRKGSKRRSFAIFLLFRGIYNLLIISDARKRHKSYVVK